MRFHLPLWVVTALAVVAASGSAVAGAPDRPVPSAAATTFADGDVNGDGRTDVADLVIVRQVLAGGILMNQAPCTRPGGGDFNADLRLDGADAEGLDKLLADRAGPPPARLRFLDDFEADNYSGNIWAPRPWFAFDAGRDGGVSLRVENPVAGDSVMVGTSIVIKPVRNWLLGLTADIRAENVSVPPNPWNGVKLMLRTVSTDGRVEWPQVTVGTGSFGWTAFGALFAVPADAAQATLYLGLEASTGRVWFDNVRLEGVRAPEDFPPARDPSIPIPVLHPEPRLRGAMVSTLAGPGDLAVLGGDWKANVIRWQLGGTVFPEGLSTPGYDALLEQELGLLDAALPVCREHGLRVVADLHSLSGGACASPAAQDRLVDVWRLIAARYRDREEVWAYDLANEPALGETWSRETLPWDRLAERVARAIRGIDAVKPVIVESVFGAPSTFRYLVPLDFSIPNVIYSAHLYEPGAFTHQGVYGGTDAYVYPGFIAGESWDKERLRTALQPVRDFQEKYRVPVFVGEFSAVRWAPDHSAYRYLRDVVELFEEYGWDWCYHAFREWHGWSVEHGEDPFITEPSPTPTDRQLLLRTWFDLNEKPWNRR